MMYKEQQVKKKGQKETPDKSIGEKCNTGTNIKKRNACIIILGIILSGTILISGCKIVPKEQQRREAEFVVVSEDCIPKELAALIESRKEEDIKLTYMDEGKRYIVIGYGKQKGGGYSIYVKDFYVTENALYVDTCLMGPREKAPKKEVASYPVIVLQTEESGLPVVFK